MESKHLKFVLLSHPVINLLELFILNFIKS